VLRSAPQPVAQPSRPVAEQVFQPQHRLVTSGEAGAALPICTGCDSIQAIHTASFSFSLFWLRVRLSLPVPNTTRRRIGRVNTWRVRHPLPCFVGLSDGSTHLCNVESFNTYSRSDLRDFK
jgi:hypothetical protein